MCLPQSRRTLPLLEFASRSKLSKHEDDLSSTRSISSHEIAESKLLVEDSATFYTFSTMPAMMTNIASLEEQVMNMSKMMETMMKHIKDQDALKPKRLRY